MHEGAGGTTAFECAWLLSGGGSLLVASFEDAGLSLCWLVGSWEGCVALAFS